MVAQATSCARLLTAIPLRVNEEADRFALRAGKGVSLGRAAPTQPLRAYVGVTLGGMFWLSAKMFSGSYLSFNATSRLNFSSP
jgi:hypothetical protein